MSLNKKNKKKQQKKQPQPRTGDQLLCFLLAFILFVGAISVGFIANNSDHASLSATQPAVSAGDRWTYGDSDDVFEQAFEEFRTLVTDFGNLKAYYNDNEFTTAEDNMAYEEMWKNLSDEAKAIQAALTVKCPPKEYGAAWNGFAECMGQISKLLVSFDHEYTAAEIAIWISEASYEFNGLSNKAWEFTNDLLEINKTITEVTDYFFLQIYDSEYQPVTRYKLTLTGMISTTNREIESVAFEHIAGDECELGYEIDGDTVSVMITHSAEGCLLRIFTLNSSGEFTAN